MRSISLSEKKQRGCTYCLDKKVVRLDKKLSNVCPYSKCPYTVLDNYGSYDEFLKSKDSQISVSEFFDSMASCYTLANSGALPRKMFYKAKNVSLF